MKIKNILICEDIRHELGNKLSLMGLFGDSINVDISPDTPKESPLSMILTSLITIENTSTKNDFNDFAISIVISRGETQIAKMNAQIEPVGDGSSSLLHIPVPKFGFPLIESAKLVIKAEIIKANKSISEDTATINININRTAR